MDKKDKKEDFSEIKSWAEWYDRRAQYYDNPLLKMAYDIRGVPIPYQVMEATIEDVWRKLRAKRDSTLLDVGVGAGLFCRAFQLRLRHIIGTDISWYMVRDANRLNPRSIFLACEAARLPFVSGSFDRLLCYSVFHYFPDLAYAKEALTEFIRIVKDGGLVLVGDVPVNMEYAEQLQAKCTCEATAKQLIQYPAFLKHNFKYTTYNSEFFVEYCAANGHGIDILKQNVKGKATAAYRFDVLIEVRNQ